MFVNNKANREGVIGFLPPSSLSFLRAACDNNRAARRHAARKMNKVVAGKDKINNGQRKLKAAAIPRVSFFLSPPYPLLIQPGLFQIRADFLDSLMSNNTHLTVSFRTRSQSF